MPIVLIGLSLAGLIAGIIIFWRAWRTRHGTVVHCAHCNTDISITGTGRCPRCKREINEATIAIGKHKPEWSLMFVGGMAAIVSTGLILIAVIWMSARLQTTWYTVYDNKQVMADLADANGMHRAAARTLADRMYRKTLTQAELDELSEIIYRSLHAPEPAMLPRIDPRHVLAAELIWHGEMEAEEIENYLSRQIIINRNQGGQPDEAPIRIIFGPKVIPGLPVRFRLTPIYSVEVISADGKILNMQGPTVAYLSNGCYTLRASELHAFTVNPQESLALRVTVNWYNLTDLDRELIGVARGEIRTVDDDDPVLGQIREQILARKAPILCTAQYVVSMEATEGWVPVFQAGLAATEVSPAESLDADIDLPSEYVEY